MSQDRADVLVVPITWRHPCRVYNLEDVDAVTCLRLTTVPTTNVRSCNKGNKPCRASLRHCPECLHKGKARRMSALALSGSQFCKLHGDKLRVAPEERGQRVVDLAVIAKGYKPDYRAGGQAAVHPPVGPTGTVAAEDSGGALTEVATRTTKKSSKPKPVVLPSAGALDAVVAQAEVETTAVMVVDKEEQGDVKEPVAVTELRVPKLSLAVLQHADTVFALRSPPISMSDDSIRSVLDISQRRLNDLIKISEGEEFQRHRQQKTATQTIVTRPTKRQLQAWRVVASSVSTVKHLLFPIPEMLTTIGADFLKDKGKGVVILNEQLEWIAAEVDRIRKILG